MAASEAAPQEITATSISAPGLHVHEYAAGDTASLARLIHQASNASTRPSFVFPSRRKAVASAANFRAEVLQSLHRRYAQPYRKKMKADREGLGLGYSYPTCLLR
jgi:hypothetical protein